MILGVQSLAAQDFSIGLKGGVSNNDFSDLRSEMTYSIGLNTEYTPPKAMFSISADLQYFIEQKVFLAPFSLSLVFGKRICPRVIVGILPVIRINPIEPNIPFGIGARAGIGLDYKISEKIAISSELGWHFIPYRQDYSSHFGSSDIDRVIGRLQNLAIGVKYYI